ncbi:MAG: hypothetical protein Q8R10_15120 [Pseudomonas sp.]|uniref:hypothetical protein n=1 Tax=Pseudomonas sp. TaxID=306 RepID=UPI00273429D1|nr:hypothetical protein [Pseudomonas sp.]MDP3847748.1 hypothetical protein [Pseudomonas sp.]
MDAVTLKSELNPRRGRLQLLLILAATIGPILLATAMYKWQFWVPESRSYHGELLGSGQSRSELGVIAQDEKRWQLLVTAPEDCAADCQQLVYLARQIQIGLGRESSRASHGLASAAPLSEAYQAQLQREYPQLGRFELERQRYDQLLKGNPAVQLWIIDPHGNLVLRYDAKADGKQVLTDLRLLLKLSNIG